ETLGMSWCLDCHRNPGPHLRPEERVTDLAWSPKDPEKTGSIIRAEKNIHPSESCSACHR
ncbi:MAG: cytochrome C, partial [Candidatus Krumholzibacteria bacterium]|nr:cytochrome C [Candidatus Krumholzibacteria bacterium]